MADPIRWQDRWWHQQADGSWLLFNEETQTWEQYSGPAAQTVYAPSPGMSTGAKWAIGLGVGAAVLVILMVLAAIAIPVFLRQREKGWITQVEEGLRLAAIAEESYCSRSEECYTTELDELSADGLAYADDVSLRVVTATQDRYCIEGRHAELPNEVWSYDSSVGHPREGPCL